MEQSFRWVGIESPLPEDEVRRRLKSAVSAQRRWLVGRGARSTFPGTVSGEHFFLRSASLRRVFTIEGSIAPFERGTSVQLNVGAARRWSVLPLLGVGLTVCAFVWTAFNQFTQTLWSLDTGVQAAAIVAGIALCELSSPKVSDGDLKRIVKRIGSIVEAVERNQPQNPTEDRTEDTPTLGG